MRTKRATRTLTAIVAAAVAAIAATIALPALSSPPAGYPSTPPAVTAPSPVPPATDPGSLTPTAAAALKQLEQLTVAAPADQGTYDRDLFGQRWADIDRNGCGQRDDELARSMTDLTFKPGTHDCVVLTGILHDPYTGQTIAFQRGQGTSELVQIDHFVPLAWAWRQGASTWTEEQREYFANDPLNLQATDGTANQSKSDRGPAEWMPPSTAYHCTYAARFVGVLTTYQLTVDQADYAALQAQLSSCTS